MNRLIRISGGTASGKSTIAAEFAKKTNCLLLSHDRYYVDIEKPGNFNFDEPDAMDNALLVRHIADLISGKPVELPIYDFPTHSRQQEREGGRQSLSG